MRVTVIFNETDGEVFEAYCKKNGFKKSTLINRLVSEHIKNSDFRFQKELFDTSSAIGGEHGEK